MKKLSLFILMFILSGCATHPPATAIPGPTGVGGKVHDPSGQVAIGAFVYAYRSPRGGLRGPADFEAEVAESGDYFLDLSEGTYHLVARMRRSGGDAGPPRAGDAWALWPHNPVTVVAGMTSRADFSMQGVTQPRLLREGSLSSGNTGFSGRLVDADGKPVAGAFVLAYRTPDHRRMPDHTSAPVSTDGRFVLYLPKAGRYCLAARTKTRGQPHEGEPYGVLAPGEAGCRDLAAGTISEVGDIVLTPYGSGRAAETSD